MPAAGQTNAKPPVKPASSDNEVGTTCGRPPRMSEADRELAERELWFRLRRLGCG